MFHEPRTGSVSSVTIDDKTLDSMVDTSVVNLALDFREDEDVDSNGNIFYVEKNTAFQELESLLNVDIYFQRPVITGPQYNYTPEQAELTATEFQAIQPGCTIVKSVWEFCQDGKFDPKTTTSIEKTQAPYHTCQYVSGAGAKEIYARVTYTGRSPDSAESSLTSNARIFSVRPQIEKDFMSFVFCIERSDIIRGMCTFPKMAVNMGMITNESEFREDHKNRMLSLLEKYKTDTVALKKKSETIDSGSNITSAETNVQWNLNVNNRSFSIKFLSNDPTSGKNYATQLTDSNGSIGARSKILYGSETVSTVPNLDFGVVFKEHAHKLNSPFDCVVVEIKNDIFRDWCDDNYFSADKFAIFIDKYPNNAESRPENQGVTGAQGSTFFTVNGPTTNFLAKFNIKNQHQGTTGFPETVNLAVDWYRMKPVQGSPYEAYITDEDGNILPDDYFLDVWTKDFKVKVSGDDVDRVDVRIDNPHWGDVQIDGNVSELGDPSGNVVPYRFTLTPGRDHYGRRYCGMVTELIFKVIIITRSNKDIEFNFSYRVGILRGAVKTGPGYPVGAIISSNKGSQKTYHVQFSPTDSGREVQLTPRYDYYKYMGDAWCDQNGDSYELEYLFYIPKDIPDGDPNTWVLRFPGSRWWTNLSGQGGGDDFSSFDGQHISTISDNAIKNLAIDAFRNLSGVDTSNMIFIKMPVYKSRYITGNRFSEGVIETFQSDIIGPDHVIMGGSYNIKCPDPSRPVPSGMLNYLSISCKFPLLFKHNIVVNVTEIKMNNPENNPYEYEPDQTVFQYSLDGDGTFGADDGGWDNGKYRYGTTFVPPSIHSCPIVFRIRHDVYNQCSTCGRYHPAILRRAWFKVQRVKGVDPVVITYNDRDPSISNGYYPSGRATGEINMSIQLRYPDTEWSDYTISKCTWKEGTNQFYFPYGPSGIRNVISMPHPDDVPTGWPIDLQFKPYHSEYFYDRDVETAAYIDDGAGNNFYDVTGKELFLSLVTEWNEGEDVTDRVSGGADVYYGTATKAVDLGKCSINYRDHQTYGIWFQGMVLCNGGYGHGDLYGRVTGKEITPILEKDRWVAGNDRLTLQEEDVE